MSSPWRCAPRHGGRFSPPPAAGSTTLTLHAANPARSSPAPSRVRPQCRPGSGCFGDSAEGTAQASRRSHSPTARSSCSRSAPRRCSRRSPQPPCRRSRTRCPRRCAGRPRCLGPFGWSTALLPPARRRDRVLAMAPRTRLARSSGHSPRWRWSGPGSSSSGSGFPPTPPTCPRPVLHGRDRPPPDRRRYGPAATVAALGATNLATATAAGMVVSAATVLAVLLYAGAFWALGARFTGRDVDAAERATVIPLPVRGGRTADAEIDLAA